MKILLEYFSSATTNSCRFSSISLNIWICNSIIEKTEAAAGETIMTSGWYSRECTIINGRQEVVPCRFFVLNAIYCRKTPINEEKRSQWPSAAQRPNKPLLFIQCVPKDPKEITSPCITFFKKRGSNVNARKRKCH